MSASFQELGLHPNILKGIHDLGFTRPSPIQAEAIPHILLGKDVIACAQTGTGKTAAFVLPLLHRLLSFPAKKKGVRVLVIAPTRELALQSMDHLKDLSRHVPLKGHAIYGGVPMGPQVSALNSGLDIISATPGRLLDHIYQGRIDFGALETLVLDEADRMMDMGFLPDIQKIISMCPPKRQNLIVSATMPAEIMKLVQQICVDPVTVQIGIKSTTAAGIRHAVYPVGQDQKPELLLRLLNDGGPKMTSVIVFTRTKSRAERLGQMMERAGITTSVIHGDRSQIQRSRALDYFKQGKTQLLVATDVAARGIDVKDISHVINFDVPQSPEDYIHRSGRTARAETTGDSFCLVAPEEEEMVRDIERVINQRLPRVTLPDFNYSKGGSSSSHGHRPHASRPQTGGSHGRPPFRTGGHRPSGGGHSRPRPH
jgi:ATP-dependent RNA helicase RhlE